MRASRSGQQAGHGSPPQYLRLSELLSYVEQVLYQGIPESVWVKAELASVTDRRHLYFDLLEVGEEQAKCRATLWASERYRLEAKLKKATGEGFRAGMQVLLLCSVQFHVQYGFSLSVEDVAPELSVGAAALQYQAMRQELMNAGLYDQNRSLAPLRQVYRVAVISPPQAAGLEDFRKEIDPLAAHGLLEMHYFAATFQGKEAAGELLRAVGGARQLHEQQPLDALVIVRGGGASVDLAWLNQLELARQVAAFPVPVITGLGHARDDTLLDEVAAIRTDTPSKAAHLLSKMVFREAKQAESDYAAIQHYAVQLWQRSQHSVQQQKERVRVAALHSSNRAEQVTRQLMGAALGLSVERTLGRGYAYVRGPEAQLVSTVQQAQQQPMLRLVFADGELLVRPVSAADSA